MRAAVLQTSPIPVVSTFDMPVAGDGEELVQVLAAGINPIDLILAKAHFAGPAPKPIVPGREGIGIVAGERIYFSSAGSVFGSMAEYSTARTERLIPVPDNLSDEDAITLGIAGLTAWLSLSNAAGIKQGEHVLVLGAGGAVGGLAVQAARLLGAGRVIAASRSAAGIQKALEGGADAGVILDDSVDLGQKYQAAAGGRIDIVLDPIWGPHAISALQAGSPGVRLIQIGNSSGPDVPLNPAFMRMGGKRIIGFSSGSVSDAERKTVYQRLCGHRAAGELKFDVESVSLARVADAWKRQSEFPHKKLVLQI